MSSVWTFRLKRRKRFSIDSPSCDRTSAKSASRNAEIRCVPSVPYKAWPDTLQPIHGSFCNKHPYVHGNELRTASMTRTDARMCSCAGLSRRYFTTVRTAWFVETLDGTKGMVHQRCFFVFFQHLHGTVHVMNAHDVTDAQRSHTAGLRFRCCKPACEPKSFQRLPKLDRRTRIVHALEVSESTCARKL